MSLSLARIFLIAPHIFISDFQDCNNLYGYAMMMKLPHSDFRWLSEQEIESFDIEGFDVNSDYGVVLEVLNSRFIEIHISEFAHNNTYALKLNCLRD